MYPPLGPGMVWPITTPGERSDHGPAGHGLFLGSGADAQDIGDTLQQLYAVGAGGVFHQEEYTSADGQYRGWNIFYQTDSGFTIVYAHCEEPATKNRYDEGEPIARVGEYLNYDHCHFEVDGVAAGDMPALFAAIQPEAKQGDDIMILNIDGKNETAVIPCDNATFIRINNKGVAGYVYIEGFAAAGNALYAKDVSVGANGTWGKWAGEIADGISQLRIHAKQGSFAIGVTRG